MLSEQGPFFRSEDVENVTIVCLLFLNSQPVLETDASEGIEESIVNIPLIVELLLSLSTLKVYPPLLLFGGFSRQDLSDSDKQKEDDSCAEHHYTVHDYSFFFYFRSVRSYRTKEFWYPRLPSFYIIHPNYSNVKHNLVSLYNMAINIAIPQ